MFEKYHAMPLVIGLIPGGLALPNTVPLLEKQEAIGGVLRWPAPEWSEAEFGRVSEAVNSLTKMSRGKKLEDYVMALAQVVAKAIPNREFRLEVSNFGIDYKPERRKK